MSTYPTKNLDTLTKHLMLNKNYVSLNYVGGGVPTGNAFFGEGRGPVHLSGAGCTSEDMNLLNCTIDKSAANGCDHSEDAGVI